MGLKETVALKHKHNWYTRLVAKTERALRLEESRVDRSRLVDVF